MQKTADRPRHARAVAGLLAAAGLACASLAFSAPARADLQAERAQLQQAWTKAGAQVRVLPSLFLVQGQVVNVGLPLKRPTGSCVRVTALAARPIKFALRAGAGDSNLDTLRDQGEVSDAGIASLEDCGNGGLASGVVQLGLASPRAAVEVLVATSVQPLPAVVSVLGARDPGVQLHLTEPTRVLKLPPVARRLARARAGARRDGARMVVPVVHVADTRGSGTLILKLSEGCHRVHVMAQQPADHVEIDIDAEARTESGRPLGSDRSHAPDARLDFCIGASDRVSLRFAGARTRVPVTIVDAYWPPPSGVPNWSELARAGMLEAMHRRRAPKLNRPPLLEVLGAAGTTIVPLQVEPNACYYAAAGLLRGNASAMRLAVRHGSGSVYDDAGDAPFGAAVSFCSRDSQQALLQLDVRGAASAWVAALWRVGKLP